MRMKIWGAFTLLTLFWGASFLWIKIAVMDLGPYTLVAIRLTFGLLGLLGFIIVEKPALPRDGRTWRALAVLGLLNTIVPWLLISWAEQTIDSALATVLNSTVPLFTIIVAHLFLADDRITVPRVLGLVIGFAGVLVLTQREVNSGELLATIGGPSSTLGQVAMLGAACMYAFGAVYARRKLRHVPALVQAFYSMSIATVIMWVLLPFVESSIVIPNRLVIWVALAWLGVLGAGVASYLFYFLLHRIGPTRTSLVTYTIPVVGVALGVIVLGESLDALLVVGTFLIVSGVWVVNSR